MQVDFQLAIAGLVVGFGVGITGMGGGALMTPILVILFKVQPLAAVSSDLVASFFMKPVGAAVHYSRGTVQRELVLWLMAGSVPSAFAGVVLLRLLGRGHQIQQVVQTGLAVALVLAAAAIVVKALLQLRAPTRGGGAEARLTDEPVRRLPTVLVGALGGLVVGMTSVGSGSLMIVALMFLYPRLTAARLVGTDLAQAIPLVGSAALSHVLFGDFRLDVAGSLILGAIPGTYLGARVSAQAPSGIVKRALAFVLLASGLKLVNAGTAEIVILVLAGAIAAELTAAWIRRLNSRAIRSVSIAQAER